jgi:hypothetical protein
VKISSIESRLAQLSLNVKKDFEQVIEMPALVSLQIKLGMIISTATTEVFGQLNGYFATRLVISYLRPIINCWKYSNGHFRKEGVRCLIMGNQRI